MSDIYPSLMNNILGKYRPIIVKNITYNVSYILHIYTRKNTVENNKGANIKVGNIP